VHLYSTFSISQLEYIDCSLFFHQGSAEFNMLDKNYLLTDHSILAMPPHQSNEEFLEAYEVVLILDDRENFGFV
jgi:hypothetical protein